MANDSPAKSLVDIDLSALRVSGRARQSGGRAAPLSACGGCGAGAGGGCGRRVAPRPRRARRAAPSSSRPPGAAAAARRAHCSRRDAHRPALAQDPAGIFELVEVVGNGTYGQVYKVSVAPPLLPARGNFRGPRARGGCLQAARPPARTAWAPSGLQRPGSRRCEEDAASRRALPGGRLPPRTASGCPQSGPEGAR